MKFIKRKDVCTMTGLSYSTIQRYEKRGLFPARRQISIHRVAWIEREVHEWIMSREQAASK